MGSFYMACVASNAPLLEGEEVVACKLKLEKGEGRGSADTFNRQWFLADFPQQGVYNDYGNVLLPDGTELESSEDDLLIMAKWAHDVLVKMVQKSWKDEDARYVEYNKQGLNYTNWRLKHIADGKAAIDTHLLLPPDPEDRGAVLLRAIEQMRTHEHLRWGGEGCANSDRFWREKILASEDPHATHDRFRAEVLPITCSTNFLYWRIIPSMYASQDDNTDELIKFYSRGLKHFRARKASW